MQISVEYSETVINKLIQDIRILPEHLKAITKKVNKKKKLQYRYRDGGWNIEQIVHHIADSHLNAFMRFKSALTENNPTIKPYDENLWAETADIQLPLKNSVRFVKALHANGLLYWKIWIKMTSSAPIFIRRTIAQFRCRKRWLYTPGTASTM